MKGDLTLTDTHTAPQGREKEDFLRKVCVFREISLSMHRHWIWYGKKTDKKGEKRNYIPGWANILKIFQNWYLQEL